LEFWIMLIVRNLKDGDEASFRACVEACRYDDPPHDFAFRFDSLTDFPSYVRIVDSWSRGECLPSNFVPGAFLVATVEEVVVGRVSIRYQLNDFLLRLGGHVGYVVAPSFRRKGYATEILRQTLPIARSAGLKRLLLTCDDDNIASRRVIEVNGGVLENVVWEEGLRLPKRRYWIDLRD
jgi:predicted acetyltransferase